MTNSINSLKDWIKEAFDGRLANCYEEVIESTIMLVYYGTIRARYSGAGVVARNTC